LDDLTRNFALNPHNGVKCSAWYRETAGAQQDAELPMLAAYLTHVATAAAPPQSASSLPSSNSSSSSSSSSSGASGWSEHNFLKWDHGKWREVALGVLLASAHPTAPAAATPAVEHSSAPNPAPAPPRPPP
jgi:hypothetical protein